MAGLLGALVGTLAFVLVLLVVIIVHESGHFFLAKLSGIRVDEFAFGFGPRLASWRRGETVYSIRAVPAGGFVRMPGMLGLEGERDAGERNFYRATVPRRIAVIMAGILANFLLGALATAVVAMAGSPPSVPAGQAAYAAGLRDGDTIVSAGGRTLDRSTPRAFIDGLRQVTRESLGAAVWVTYQRSGGPLRTVSIPPELVIDNAVPPSPETPLAQGTLIIESINGRPVHGGDPQALLGGGAVKISGRFASPAPGSETTFRDVAVSGVVGGADPVAGSRVATWRLGYSPGVAGVAPLPALGGGFRAIPAFIVDDVTAIAHVVSTPNTGGLNGPQGLSGPIGIAFASGATVRQGWVAFLAFIATVSFSVGFLNVLPIPFLDGGRLAFVLLEAIRRRRVEPRREAAISVAGLMVLVAFAVYVTIGDVHRIPDFLRSR